MLNGTKYDRFKPQWVTPGSLLEGKARRFHRRNPHIFDLAEKLMGQALAKMPQASIKLVWERMRWHYAVETEEHIINPDTQEPFKLNNNYHSYYARWLIQKNPQWKNRIRTRQLGQNRQEY